jgi:hypothetical protein
MSKLEWEIRPISQKWFAASTPVNFAGASVEIGSGTNGKVTVTHDNATTTDKIKAVVATGASKALSAAYTGGEIVVTLGTDSNSAADSTKNTATLIAAAINGISGKKWTAAASGTGVTAITSAINSTAFTDGHDGTPCPEAGIVLKNSDTYYVCIEANNTTHNTNWKSFSLSAI